MLTKQIFRRMTTCVPRVAIHLREIQNSYNKISFPQRYYTGVP